MLVSRSLDELRDVVGDEACWRHRCLHTARQRCVLIERCESMSTRRWPLSPG